MGEKNSCVREQIIIINLRQFDQELLNFLDMRVLTLDWKFAFCIEKSDFSMMTELLYKTYLYISDSVQIIILRRQ